MILTQEKVNAAYGGEKEIDEETFIRLFGKPSVIGDSAFEDCDNLERVVIPEGVVAICHSAFYQLPLKEVTFPKSLAVIGSAAFKFCEELKKITFLGDSVEYIVDSAFHYTSLVVEDEQFCNEFDWDLFYEQAEGVEIKHMDETY